MKKHLLVFAIAVAIMSFGSFVALAQTPFIQVVFDNALQRGDGYCPGAPTGSVLDTVHVVGFNFNMYVNAAEFMVDYSSAMFKMGEWYPAGALAIGNSSTGLSLAYVVPVPAFDPAVLMSANFLWMCSGCAVQDIEVHVVPHPVSGVIRIVDWPSLTSIYPVEMVSLICPSVGNEESTWGEIKALYND